MLILQPDVDDPYVPFVGSRHEQSRLHEVRRLEPRVGQSRRALGRVLVRAGLTVAGLRHAGSR